MVEDCEAIRIMQEPVGATALRYSVPLLLLAVFYVYRGASPVLGWAGVVVCGAAIVLATRNILRPGVAVVLDAAGVHDCAGSIPWSDVQEPRLYLVRGRAILTFCVPLATYPRRGHPHDREWPDAASCEIDLRRTRCRPEEIEARIAQWLGRPLTYIDREEDCAN